MSIDNIEYDDLWGDDDNGAPKEPFEELLKKINEIIDWINSQ